MNRIRLSCLGVAGGLAIALPFAPNHQWQARYVGTTPCGDAVRAFIGGMPAGATCYAIKWELTLDKLDGASRWRLTAVYGVPPSPNSGQMIDGPSVTRQGVLVASTVLRFGGESNLFRLTGDAGTSIALVQIGNDVVHLSRDDGSLVPGTPGWSYMLTRRDRVEPPVVEIARASEGSYSLPPKDTGSQVVGIFGGRSPCAGLARESKLSDAEGCARIKWRVTLLKDPRTNQPTIYKVDNSLNRGRTWTGAWRITHGAPGFPDATVYELEAGPTHGRILLLRADDSVVVFLDQQRQPLPGNADLSYTLNR